MSASSQPPRRSKRAPSFTERVAQSILTFNPWSFTPSTTKGKSKLRVSPPTPKTSTTYASASAIGPGVSLHVPAEIIDMIIDYVRVAHNCRTCYVRDLASLSLVNKSFQRAVEYNLYDSVQIHDGLSRRLWSGQAGGASWSSSSSNRNTVATQPMALFLRTITENPRLAEAVRFLDLSVDPDAEIPVLVETYSLIARIIDACPNLESFKGELTYFPQPMNGNRAGAVGRALYAKTSLREHSWWATVFQAGYQYFGFTFDAFVGYHDNWEMLETLVLRGWRSDRPLNRPLREEHFLGIFDRLSMKPGEWWQSYADFQGIMYVDSSTKRRARKTPLRRLYLTKFTTLEELNDSTLSATAFAFPELQALRLERVAAITTGGLLKWATCVSSNFVASLSTDPSSKLESLTIIECEMAHLGAAELSTLLISLPHLRKFTFRPWKNTFELAEIPDELEKTILTEESKGWPSMEYQPVLSHERLEYLHWHVYPPMPANYWLYYSIISGGLPNLRTLQAPNDKGGILQSLCENVVNPASEQCARLQRMVPRIKLGTVVHKAWKRAAVEFINPSPPPPLPATLQTPELSASTSNPASVSANPKIQQEIAAIRRRHLPSRITFDLRTQHPHCQTFLLLDRDLCWVKSGQPHNPADMYDEDDNEEEDTTSNDHIPATTNDDDSSATASPEASALDLLGIVADGTVTVDAGLATLQETLRGISVIEPIRSIPPASTTQLHQPFPLATDILNQPPPAARGLEPHEYEGEDYTCEYGSHAEYGDERDIRRRLAVQKACEEVGGTWCNGLWNKTHVERGNAINSSMSTTSGPIIGNIGDGSGNGGGSTSPVLQRTGSILKRTVSVMGRRQSGAVKAKERGWWHVPRPTEDLGEEEIGLKDFF